MIERDEKRPCHILFYVDLLHESFDNHPDFVFPTDGFVLDLNNPPQDSHLLQEFVENVKKELKGTKSEQIMSME